jgi:hypothetical protein
MTKHYDIERRHTRIFFSDRVNGIISSVENKQDSIPVTLLNISEGGLQCRIKRTPEIKFHVNDYFVLKQIIDLPELIPLEDIRMQIKWVMDNEHLNHITIGAAFCKLSQNQLDALQSFVRFCLALHQEENVS